MSLSLAADWGYTIISDLGYLCLRAVFFHCWLSFFFNCVGYDITRGRRLVCEDRLVKFGGLSLLLGTYDDVLPLAVISHFILSKKEGLLQRKLGLQINLASTGTLLVLLCIYCQQSLPNLFSTVGEWTI